MKLPVLPGLVNGDYFVKDRKKRWKTYFKNNKHYTI